MWVYITCVPNQGKVYLEKMDGSSEMIPNYDAIYKLQTTATTDPDQSDFFPICPRILISAPSGAGKTNLALHLIFTSIDKGGLQSRPRIIVVTGGTHEQSKYRLLAEVCKEKCRVELTVLPSFEDFLTFCEIDKYPGQDFSDRLRDSIVILDDLSISSAQRYIMRDLFAKARHHRIILMLLYQCYSRIPKFLRENANVLFLFRTDRLALSLVHRDFCLGDLTMEQFESICQQAWKNVYCPLTIVKDRCKENFKYRMGLRSFFQFE